MAGIITLVSPIAISAVLLWIRRRVKIAYWRQWRRSPTKVINLMKIGVHAQAAVVCDITSKVPWRSAKTSGINQISL